MRYNKEELIEHYLDGFPEDGRAFAEFFVSKVLTDNLSVLRLDERLISAGYIVPKRVKCKSFECEIGYLSALSTKKDFRGNGRVSVVIKDLLSKCAERKYPFVILSPFSPTYYLKYGFVNASYCSHSTIDAALSCEGYTLEDICLRDFVSIYESAYADYDYRLVYGESAFWDLKRELAVYDGKLLAVKRNDRVIGWVVTEGKGIVKYAFADGDPRKIPCFNGYNLTDFSGGNEVHTQLRIADCEAFFSVAKYASGSFEYSFRVTDEMVERNNAVFIIEKNDEIVSVRKLPYAAKIRAAEDVDASTLAEAFISGKYPFQRPSMLFLDKY